jgi:predicted O-methyltransferase YrrM
MKPIEWKNQTDFTVDGVKFFCSLADPTRKTDNDRIIILKDRASLESYYQALGNTRVRNVLEFGILEGGSAILFTLLLEPEKFVGVDIRDSARGIEPFLARHEVGKKIKFHFSVSQSDARPVRELITSEFASGPIDLIIDDASHQYTHTKRTFEIAFPYLRPGGLYVIEDWGWAHWKGWEGFMMGEPAMSMLIFELVMLCATSQEVVSDIRIFPAFTFIRKSEAATDLPDFSIEKFYQKRGLSLGFENSEQEIAARGQLEAAAALAKAFYRNVRFRVKNPIAQELRNLNLIRR